MYYLFLLLLTLLPSSVSFAQVLIPPDCNGNQVSDFEDLVSGSSQDCDRNGIPDECVGDGTERSVSFDKQLQVEGTARGYDFSIGEIDSVEGRDLVAPAGDARFMFVPNFENGEPYSFQFFVTEPRLLSTKLADVDNLNGLDVITASGEAPREIAVYRNDGGGGFSNKVAIDTDTNIIFSDRTVSLVVDELTGDSFADVVVGGKDAPAGEIVLLRSTGDGMNFVRSEICAPDAGIITAELAPVGIVAKDLDQDQDLDLIIHWNRQDSNEIRICSNQGGGSFAVTQSLSVGPPSFFTEMTVADFNADSDPDILLVRNRQTSGSFTPQAFIGKAGASFEEGIDVSSLSSEGIESIIVDDFNNDGFTDIAHAKSWRIFRVLQGSSTPLEFSKRVEFAIPREDGILIGSLRAMVLGRAVGDEAFEIYALGQSKDANRVALFKMTEASPYEEPVPPLPSRCQSPNNRFSAYGYWNTYVGMTSILELPNTTPDDSLQLIVRDPSGQTLSDTTINVPSNTQFDVIINDVPGVPADSYGTYEIRSASRLITRNRTLFYRSSSDTAKALAAFNIGDYDFATPIYNPKILRGPVSVSANTFQPSRDLTEADAPVFQWLSLTNLSSSTERYSVRTYAPDGTLLLERAYDLAPYERRDIEGGHQSLGANKLAIHQIIPEREQIPFLAGLMRYGTTNSGRSSFANWYPAVVPSAKTEFLPVARTGGREQWLEIANPNQEPAQLRVQVFNSIGLAQSSTTIEVAGFQHQHLHVSASLEIDDAGIVSVEPLNQTSKPLLFSSSYFRNIATGGIESSFSSFFSQEDTLDGFATSYNRYLGMSNFVQISSAALSGTQNVVFKSFGTRGPEQATVQIGSLGTTLTPYQTRVFNVGESSTLGTIENSYGALLASITVAQGTPDQFNRLGEILRVRTTPTGEIDFVYVLPFVD